MSEEITGKVGKLDEDELPYGTVKAVDNKYVAGEKEVMVTKLLSYWMCAYKAAQPSVETYQTAFVTAIHAALSAKNNGEKNINVDELFLQAKASAKIVDEKLYKELCSEGKEMLASAPTYSEKGQIVETRLFYNIDSEHIVTGSPDIVSTINFAVRDYKTGRIKFTPHTYPQLPFYAFLLIENGFLPKNKNIELEYLFIRDGESSKEVWSYKKIMKAADILVNTWLKHEDKRNMNLYCKYCHNIFNCQVIVDALRGNDPLRAKVAAGLINQYTDNLMYKFGTILPGDADLVKVEGEVIKYKKVEGKELRKKYPDIYWELAKDASFSKLDLSMLPIIEQSVFAEDDEEK